MSRSGYNEDYYDDGSLNLYRGAVDRASRGKRGQRMFVDLLAALDAMPEKRLIAEELVSDCGGVCALGALGQARGMDDLDKIDPEDVDIVSDRFDIAQSLAREVVYVNDEEGVYWQIGKCNSCDGKGTISMAYWSHEKREYAHRDLKCGHCDGSGQANQRRPETPEERWTRVRAWVAGQVIKSKPEASQ